MPGNKRAWSYVSGDRGRNRVRVFERTRDHLILLEWRESGRKRCKCLGRCDRLEAKRQADAQAVSLGEPAHRGDAVTLFDICSAYLRERTPEKSRSVQCHDRLTAKLLLRILGASRIVADLTHRDAARFVVERRRIGDQRPGRTKGTQSSSRQLAYDVSFVKALFNWAVGAGLLLRNPWHGFAVRDDGAPARPVLRLPEYSKLAAVAEELPSQFGLALLLAWETGHRIGAVRSLRWSDIDFDHETILWRAECDKLGWQHTTPLSSAAVGALKTKRAVEELAGNAGDGWILPSPTDPSQPCSRHVLRDWWRRAESMAGLAPSPRRGWHSCRRAFANDLRRAPLKDLTSLGGWKTPLTVVRVYQAPDVDAMREALGARAAACRTET
jgi:integrase